MLRARLALRGHHPASILSADSLAERPGGEDAPSRRSGRGFNPLHLQPGPAPAGGFQDGFFFPLCCTTGDNRGTAATKPATRAVFHSSPHVWLRQTRLSLMDATHVAEAALSEINQESNKSSLLLIRNEVKWVRF